MGGEYATKAFTKTSEKSKEIKFISFNAGIASGGLGFGGTSAGATFTIAGTRKHFSDTAEQRFELILSVARRMPSILYSPAERRAWMVPVICVLYHMAHLRIVRDRYEVRLPYAIASWDGATAAYEAIDHNRQIPIGPQDVANPYLLPDLLEELWRIMKLMDQIQPGRRTLLFQNLLYGSDLMEIVRRPVEAQNRTGV